MREPEAQQDEPQRRSTLGALALAARVRGVARLASVRGVLAAAAFATLAVGGGFLAASGLDIGLHLAVPARAACLAATVALAAWLALKAFARSRRDFRGDVPAAREVEDRFPELGRALSTAVEYGSDPVKTERCSSRELVGRLVEDASERSSPVEFRRAVSWRPCLRAALAAALALAGAGLYAAALPHMASATARRFFRPFADVPPPTWTVIRDVTPGDRELPRGESQTVEVELGGLRPREVRLIFRGEADPEWSGVEMSPSGERRHSRTLARIVRTTEYRVVAGDASSRVFRLVPVEEPRVESLRARISPPGYTGLVPEELPEGTGDVRAPVGTLVELRARVGAGVVSGSAELSLGESRKAESVALSPGTEPRELVGSFVLRESGEYRLRVRDSQGRSSQDEPVYRLTAVPDRAPQVKVLEPARDVMAARDQRVVIELEATDDWGVSELGVVHNLSGKPERASVLRPAERSRTAKASYPVELALRGFRGGEIVTYYPYAVDNDGVSGPKESIGEVRFLRTYDEERYGTPGGPDRRTPKAVREVERLISRQMELVRRTFDAARSAPEPGRTAGLASDQEDLRKDLDGLVRQVEEELAQREATAPAAMRAEEIVELHEASRSMASASEELRSGRAREAGSPQAEALTHLSRTRRILLSDSGSGDARNAISSAASRRESTREAERRRSLEDSERELEKLPPILQRQEAARRRLERLEDEPPPQRDRRELERAAEEERRLAEEARAAASRMEAASGESGALGEEPRRRLLEAARRMEDAAEAARSDDLRTAAEAASRASEELSAARASAARSIRQLERERIQGASGRAEELSRAEAELAGGLASRTSEKADSAASRRGDSASAGRQEEIRRDYEALREEVRSLTARAEREDRAEARALRQAEARSESRGISERMDAAARGLRGGRPEEAAEHARAASRALEELARGLREAAAEALSAEGRERAALVGRAERLSKESGALAERAGSPAGEPEALAGEAERLRSESRALAEAVGALQSRGEESPERRAARSLERAERSLKQAGSDLRGRNARSAAEAASVARDEAARAAKALGEGVVEEIARTLAEAAASASRSAARQDASRDELRREGGDRARASREERAAGEASARAASRLSEAASASAELGTELAELVAQERERVSRERLPERMAALAERLERGGAPGPAEQPDRAEGRTGALDDLAEAETLSRDAHEAARRLASLAAEAGGDELEALKAAAADSRELSGRLRALQSRLDELASEPSAARTREAALMAQEALSDSRVLRVRLERRARELLGAAPTLDGAERELADVRVRLSRNQPPRPSNALAAAAEAYQVIGDGLVEKIERILRQREYSVPEDEDAPPSFRDLVGRYFRALSED